MNESETRWRARGYTEEQFRAAWVAYETVAEVTEALGKPVTQQHMRRTAEVADRLGLEQKTVKGIRPICMACSCVLPFGLSDIRNGERADHRVEKDPHVAVKRVGDAWVVRCECSATSHASTWKKANARAIDHVALHRWAAM